MTRKLTRINLTGGVDKFAFMGTSVELGLDQGLGFPVPRWGFTLSPGIF